MKGPGKEPEPGNGDQRGVETNQIEPVYGDSVTGRDSALRCPRPSWRGIIRGNGPRIPKLRDGVPTRIDPI